MKNKQNLSSELQGLSRLIADATLGITDLVEALHRRIVHPPFLPTSPIQHLITDVAGITYQHIRWSTQLISGALDNTLAQLAPVLGETGSSDEKEAARAALNGVVGDYLAEKENPLQIRMQFRQGGKAFQADAKSIRKALPSVNGKILLMIHGLCMNDIQWTWNGHNHGTALASALGKTPIYLHYNSGRHISTNGNDFNELLEELLQNWPVPVEELQIVAHSMGGLLTRSALHLAQAQQKSWPKYLKKIIFLGTPHHGAGLERAGNYVDVLLEAMPYARPFARLGKIRSAGVTDLRYGNLMDADWQGSDRFAPRGDQRQHIPLPEQVACYCIAASSAKAGSLASPHWAGDGLVEVASALGQHEDPAKSLHFQPDHSWIAHETKHLDLLGDPEVYDRIRGWLGRID